MERAAATEGAGFRAMGAVEALNAAGWALRASPSTFGGLALLGLLPTLGMLLGLQYLAEARCLFATSYEYDWLVAMAALLTPLALGWRAVALGALCRGAVAALDPDAPPPRIGALLGESLERAMGLSLAGLWRVAATWLLPLLTWMLISTIDPEMDLELRTALVTAGVLLSLPVLLAGSALTMTATPRAAMAAPGTAGTSGFGFFKGLALSGLLGIVALMVYFNLHLGLGMALFLADAFFDADVSYWDHFFSLSNPVYAAILLALAWLGMDPLATVSAAYLWVDGRVRRDAIDLGGRLDAVIARGRQRAPGKATLRNPSAEGDRERISALPLLALALGGALALHASPLAAQEPDDAAQEAPAPSQEPVEGFAARLERARHLLAEPGGERWSRHQALEALAQEAAEGAQSPQEARFWEDILAEIHDLRGQWEEDALANGEARLKARLQGPRVGASARRADPDPQEVRAAVQEILAGEEFVDLAAAQVARDNPSLDLELQRAQEDRQREERQQERLCSPSGGGFGRPSQAPSGVQLPKIEPSALAFQVLAVGLLALALLLILLAVGRRMARRGRAAAGLPGVPGALEQQTPGQEDALAFAPADWRARALRLAEQGELRLALRALYLALLVALHREGLLEYDQARTNWEYALALRQRGAPAPVSAAFDALTGHFDLTWYGERPLSDDDFRRCLAWADAVLARATPSPEEPA
jgi:hypothetical protein